METHSKMGDNLPESGRSVYFVPRKILEIEVSQGLKRDQGRRKVSGPMISLNYGCHR